MGNAENFLYRKSIDLKNQKILKCLFENGRQSYSSIAKSVGLSKESVNYRIKGMEKTGLIHRFNTVINAKRLGWKYFMVFMRLRLIEREDEIIKYLIKQPNSAMVQRMNGSYDIIVKFFVKAEGDIGNILKEFESRYENDLDSYEICILIEEEPLTPSFLWPDIENERYTRIIYKKAAVDDIDDIDYKILKEISNNSRMPISDICKNIGITRDIAGYRLKKMEKGNITLKYRPSIWSNIEVEYLWYFVILNFKMIGKDTEKRLYDFLANHKNTSYFYKTVGRIDMGIELKLRKTIELNEFLHDIKSLLGGYLKRYEVLIIIKEHKYTYFPNCMLKASGD